MVSPIKQYAPLDMTDQNRIINVGDPVNQSDAATKGYTDARAPLTTPGDTLYYKALGGAVINSQGGPFTGNNSMAGAMVTGLTPGHTYRVNLVGHVTGGVVRNYVNTYSTSGTQIRSVQYGELGSGSYQWDITLQTGEHGLWIYFWGGSWYASDITYTDLDVGAPAALPIGDEGDAYRVVSGAPAWVSDPPVTGKIEIGLDGNGVPPRTGIRADWIVPFDLTLTGWTVVADASGSIQVDLWRSTLAAYPPVVGGSITGSDKPRLSGAQTASSTALTGWTKSLSAGDCIRVNLDSVSTITRATIALSYTKA